MIQHGDNHDLSRESSSLHSTTCTKLADTPTKRDGTANSPVHSETPLRPLRLLLFLKWTTTSYMYFCRCRYHLSSPRRTFSMPVRTYIGIYIASLLHIILHSRTQVLNSPAVYYLYIRYGIRFIHSKCNAFKLRFLHAFYLRKYYISLLLRYNIHDKLEIPTRYLAGLPTVSLPGYNGNSMEFSKFTSLMVRTHRRFI